MRLSPCSEGENNTAVGMVFMGLFPSMSGPFRSDWLAKECSRNGRMPCVRHQWVLEA